MAYKSKEDVIKALKICSDEIKDVHIRTISCRTTQMYFYVPIK